MSNDMHAPRPHTARTLSPKLVTVIALDGWDVAAVLALAASAAKGLNTAVAASIVDSAIERESEMCQVDRLHRPNAAGAAAVAGGHTVVLGNAMLFSGLGLSVSSLGDWPERLRQRGESVLLVAVDGRTAGLLGVTDGMPSANAHTRVGGENA